MTGGGESLEQLPSMGSPAACQRPLAEGGLRALEGWPSELLGTVAPVEPPESPVLKLVTGRVVASVEELEALAEEGEAEDDEGGERGWEAALELAVGSSEELFEGDDGVDAPRGVALAPTRAPVTGHDERHRQVAYDAADRLLQLARDRDERPFAERAEGERRMFAQLDALICIGGSSLVELAAWHDEVGSPEASWVLVFALACLEGREPMEVVAERMAGAGEWTRARAMAEAFATSPNPHHVPLARALLRRGEDGATAAALLLLSLRGEVPAADLLAWLGSGGPLTKAASIRGLSRCADVRQAPREVIAELAHEDGNVAWEAARACTRWGSHAAYSELRNGGGLVERLGPRAAEIYVMIGEPDDTERLQRLVSRHPMTPALLDAVARFGMATTWSFLCHYLGDAFLQGDAERALRTLFGEAVPAEASVDPFVWEKAVGALRLDDSRRWRRGRPWTPAAVCEEWAEGDLPGSAIARRLDELAGRADVQVPVALHAWGDGTALGLEQVKAAATDAARSYRAGSWRWR